MNVLIVLAHPEPHSFNAALAHHAAQALQGAGHDALISDLYADRFDAAAGRQDFASQADTSRFHLQSEQLNAARKRAFAPDIEREQTRVRNADALILQFPLWWGGPPAILKGWVDRVLAYGFAYADDARYDRGYFKGRRALISVTTGGTPERFSEAGVYGEIAKVLWPLQRLTLEYLGYEVEPIFCAYGAPRTDAAGRSAYLTELCVRALAMAGKPVSRTSLPAPGEVGDGAWSKPG